MSAVLDTLRVVLVLGWPVMLFLVVAGVCAWKLDR